MKPAVITADMVNSTRFSSLDGGAWLQMLLVQLGSSPLFDWELKPEIYRGDSFQGVLKTPDEALRLAILARTIMRAHTTDTDLRVSIGIGTANQITDRPGTSDGEAFRLSGRLSDQMKDRKARIAFSFPQPAPIFDATMDLLETLIDGWTVAQCQVISALLIQKSINEISHMLSISQSAVSQRATAAQWWAVNSLLASFPAYLAKYSAP